jgi:hypothetical protein
MVPKWLLTEVTMVLDKTLGALRNLVNEKKAKEKVKEVEDQRQFSNVKAAIAQMVAATNPTTKKATDKARENAIAFHIDINDKFGLAVTQRLLKFIQTGT